MLNRIFGRLLSALAGRYLDGLAERDLNVSVFSGTVNLANLTVKPTVFDALNLPIAVQRSVVGRLVLVFPWRSLQTSVVRVEIQDLFLVARPRLSGRDITPQEAEAQLERTKAAILQAFEDRRRLRENLSGAAARKEGWLACLAYQVLRNLEVSIRAVHIRLEWDAAPFPFACGVCLATATLSRASATTAVHVSKAAELTGLQLYLDTPESTACLDTADLADEACWGFLRASITSAHHLPLLGPLTATATVQVPLKGPDMRYEVVVSVPHFPAALRRDQYVALLHAAEAVASWGRLLRYAALRPAVPLRAHAGRYWRFALQAITAHARALRSRQSTMFWVLQDVKQARYIELYKRCQSYPWMPVASPEDQARMKRLERLTDAHDLVKWRKQALRQAEEERKRFVPLEPASPPPAPEPQGWVSWMLGWTAEPSASPAAAAAPVRGGSAQPGLTATERKELYALLQYDEDPQWEGDEALSLRLEVAIPLLTANLGDAHNAPLSTLTLAGVAAGLRSAGSRKEAGLRVASLTLLDAAADATLRHVVASADDVLHAELWRLPAGDAADVRIALRLRPVAVTLGPQWLGRLKGLLGRPASLPASASLQDAVWRRVVASSQTAMEGLRTALSSSTVLEVEVEVTAPTLCLVSTSTGPTTACLALSLGCFELRSEAGDRHRVRRVRHTTRAASPEDFYDTFTAQFRDVEVRAGWWTAGAGWAAAPEGEEGPPPVPCPPTGTDSGGLLGLPPLQVVGPVGGSGSVHRLLTAGGVHGMDNLRLDFTVQELALRASPVSLVAVLPVVFALTRSLRPTAPAVKDDAVCFSAEVSLLVCPVASLPPAESCTLLLRPASLQLILTGDAVVTIQLAGARLPTLAAAPADNTVLCLELPQADPNTPLRFVWRHGDPIEAVRARDAIRQCVMDLGERDRRRGEAGHIAPGPADPNHSERRPFCMTCSLRVEAAYLSLRKEADLEPSSSPAMAPELRLTLGLVALSLGLHGAFEAQLTVADLRLQDSACSVDVLRCEEPPTDHSKAAPAAPTAVRCVVQVGADRGVDVAVVLREARAAVERTAIPGWIRTVLLYSDIYRAEVSAYSTSTTTYGAVPATLDGAAKGTPPHRVTITSSLKAFSLSLLNQNRDVFLLCLSAGGVTLQTGGAPLGLAAHLGDVQAFYWLPESKYHQVLGLGEDVANSIVVTYGALPQGGPSHLPATLTSLLVVEVYGARVVYLGRCVADLLRFVNVDYFVQRLPPAKQHQAAQAYATTRQAAVGIVAAVLATAAPRQGLLQYSIRLVGPVAIFPHRPSALTHATVRLSSLRVLNVLRPCRHLHASAGGGIEAEIAGLPGPLLEQAITIDAHDVCISMGAGPPEPVVDGVTVVCDVVKPVGAAAPLCPALWVELGWDTLSLTASKPAYDALFYVLWGNILDASRDESIEVGSPATPAPGVPAATVHKTDVPGQAPSNAVAAAGQGIGAAAASPLPPPALRCSVACPSTCLRVVDPARAVVALLEVEELVVEVYNCPQQGRRVEASVRGIRVTGPWYETLLTCGPSPSRLLWTSDTLGWQRLDLDLHTVRLTVHRGPLLALYPVFFLPTWPPIGPSLFPAGPGGSPAAGDLRLSGDVALRGDLRLDPQHRIVVAGVARGAEVCIDGRGRSIMFPAGCRFNGPGCADATQPAVVVPHDVTLRFRSAVLLLDAGQLGDYCAVPAGAAVLAAAEDGVTVVCRPSLLAQGAAVEAARPSVRGNLDLALRFPGGVQLLLPSDPEECGPALRVTADPTVSYGYHGEAAYLAVVLANAEAHTVAALDAGSASRRCHASPLRAPRRLDSGIDGSGLPWTLVVARTDLCVRYRLLPPPAAGRPAQAEWVATATDCTVRASGPSLGHLRLALAALQAAGPPPLAAADSPAPSGPPPPATPALRTLASLEGLQFYLMDGDDGGYEGPLFRYELQSFELDFHHTPLATSEGRVAFTQEAWHFNRHVVAWEPVLERHPLQVTVRRTLEAQNPVAGRHRRPPTTQSRPLAAVLAQAPPATSAHLAVEVAAAAPGRPAAPVDFCVSAAALQTLAAAGRRWAETPEPLLPPFSRDGSLTGWAGRVRTVLTVELDPSGHPQLPSGSPRGAGGPLPAAAYYVVNETGLPLAALLYPPAGDSAGIAPALGAGAEPRRVELPDAAVLAIRAAQGERPPRVALEFFQASEWLSLAGVGQQTLALPEGRGLYSAVLVVDRALEGPALWLRLRSRFAFVNHTDRPLVAHLTATPARPVALPLPAATPAPCGVPLTVLAADTAFRLRFVERSASSDAGGDSICGRQNSSMEDATMGLLLCDSEPDVKDARQPLQPPKLPKGLADREAASSSAALDPLDPDGGAVSDPPTPLTDLRARPAPYHVVRFRGAGAPRCLLAAVHNPNPISRSGCITVNLHPPLVVHNLLPIPFTAVLLVGSVAAAQLRVPAGQRGCCYALDPGQEAWLQLTLEGPNGHSLCSSSAALIHRPGPRPRAQQCVEFRQAAAAAQPLRLVILVLGDAGTTPSVEVHVHSPCWVANASPWPLADLDFRMNDEPVPSFSRLTTAAMEDVVVLSAVEGVSFGHGLSVAIRRSCFSKPVPLDVVGQVGAVHCVSRDGARCYFLGVSVALAPSPFHRTRIVTLTHLYAVVNDTPLPLALRQADAPAAVLCRVPPGGQERLTAWRGGPRPQPQQPPLLHCRLDAREEEAGQGGEWSAAFTIGTQGCQDLRLYHAGREEYVTLNARVWLLGSVVCLTLRPALGPTVTLVNHSAHLLLARQSDSAAPWDRVRPFESLPFYWPDPLLEKRLQLLAADNERGITDAELRREADLKKLEGVLHILHAGNSEVGSNILELDPWKLGSVHPLRATPNELQVRVDLGTDSIAVQVVDVPLCREISAHRPREARTSPSDTCEVVCTLSVRVTLVGPVSGTPQEVALLTLRNVNLNLNIKPDEALEVWLTIKEVQVDDQATRPRFPVVLACRPARAGRPAGRIVPAFSLGLQRSPASSSNVLRFDFLCCQVQPVGLWLHGAWLFRLLAVLDLVSAAAPPPTLDLAGLSVPPLADAGGGAGVGGVRVFFRTLQLDPISLSVTIALQKQPTSAEAQNRLIVKLNTIAAAVPVVEDAALGFSSLTLRNPFCTASELAWIVGQHYVSEALVQFYRVLGSLEVLGNPVQLLKGVSEGLQRIFIDPADLFDDDSATDEPLFMVERLSEGARFIVLSPLHSLATALSTVSGAACNVLGVLSCDPKYRRAPCRRNHPMGVWDGCVMASEALLLGVVSGGRGVLTKPYKGYRARGGWGLARGMGVGLVGVLVKPITGALDFVHHATLVLCSLTSVRAAAPQRERLPRAVVHAVVGPYRARLAVAQHLLRTVHRGRYVGDELLACVGPLYPLPSPRAVATAATEDLQTSNSVIAPSCDPNLCIVTSDHRFLCLHATTHRKLWAAKFSAISKLAQLQAAVLLQFTRRAREGLQRRRRAEVRAVRCAGVAEASDLVRWVVRFYPSVSVVSVTAESELAALTMNTYQNERWDPEGGWGQHLLPTDCREWSDWYGTAYTPPESFTLPEGCVWAGAWDVAVGLETDAAGWRYAADFRGPYRSEPEVSSGPAASAVPERGVRRRLWVRPYAQSLAVPRRTPSEASDDDLRPMVASTPVQGVQARQAETWENQRYYLVLGWSSHLLPLERPSWSDTTGRRKQPREGFVLPAHQCWAGPWYVSPESMADPEGWQYAPNFQAAFRSAKRKRDYVRRRRWVRAIRDVDPSPAGSPGAPTDLSHPQSVVLTIGEPSE